MGRTLEDENSLWSDIDIQRFALFNANGWLIFIQRDLGRAS